MPHPMDSKPIRATIYELGGKDVKQPNMDTIFFEARKKDNNLVELETNAKCDKFVSEDMNDHEEHVLQHMRRLWNNWRGLLHKNLKSKNCDSLTNVPKGVEKRDFEWLVKEHLLSEKFKDEIQNLLQSDSFVTNIDVVECALDINIRFMWLDLVVG
ncbi:hypothetical protein HAX54_006317 [Datura stramonium]|uniref:Uncharacterized protein n=1 Tax=Datura stramonium TaxID=4076 RepID=A0ABS8TA31_DATST|nr:hypothetical protein [Datura stramonium]